MKIFFDLILTNIESIFKLMIWCRQIWVTTEVELLCIEMGCSRLFWSTEDRTSFWRNPHHNCVSHYCQNQFTITCNWWSEWGCQSPVEWAWGNDSRSKFFEIVVLGFKIFLGLCSSCGGSSGRKEAWSDLDHVSQTWLNDKTHLPGFYWENGSSEGSESEIVIYNIQIFHIWSNCIWFNYFWMNFLFWFYVA